MKDFTVFPLLEGSLGRCLFQLYYAKYYSEIHNIELKLIRDDSSENQIILDRLFPGIKMISYPQKYTTLDYSEESHAIQPTSEYTQLKGVPMLYKYCSHTNLFPNWKNALMKASIQVIVDANLINYEMQRNTWMIHYKDDTSLDTYYKLCMDLIPSGKRLHVFSNKECREAILELTKNQNIVVTFSKETQPLQALYEMTYCLGGSITANSSFGWWGAFYARKRALNFGHKMASYYPETSNVVPSWGTKIAIH